MKVCWKCRSHIIQTFFITFLFFTILPKNVFAGNINGNESRVLSAMAAVYEYDGKKYKLAGEYIAEARSYLSQDEVDLTAADAQEVLNIAYADIGQGVAEGYLIEVDTGESTDNAETDNTKIDNTKIEDTKLEDIKIGNKPEIMTEKPYKKEIEEAKKKLQKRQFSIEKNSEKANIVVKNYAGEQVLKLPGIIKNTGFSLRKTILLSGSFAIAVVIFLAVAAKRYLFAHNDE